MGGAIQHWEFAPTDLGFCIADASTKAKIVRHLTRLGWSDATGLFSAEDLETITPNLVALYKHGDVVLYIPTSGFATVRYCCPTREATEDGALKALRQRQAFQRALPSDEEDSDNPFLTDMAHQRAVAREAISTLRQLRPNRGLHRSTCNPTLAPHEYSLSMFVCSTKPSWSHMLTHPRSTGITVNKNPAPAQKATPDEQQQSSEKLFSATWSTLTLWTDDEEASATASLCEFRTQSTWLGAYVAARTAQELDFSDDLNRDSGKLNGLHADFLTLHSRCMARLGTNSPEFATQLLDAIQDTSNLENELEGAKLALEIAHIRNDLERNRRSRLSQQLFAVLGLVFASSSLAQVLLPTPITASVISTHIPQFTAWTACTVLGIVFAIKAK